jgi:hypothetical protein
MCWLLTIIGTAVGTERGIQEQRTRNKTKTISYPKPGVFPVKAQPVRVDVVTAVGIQINTVSDVINILPEATNHHRRISSSRVA